MDALTKAFLEWANRKGYDTAHAYNQNESRWIFLSPMTADVYEAWQAARMVPEVITTAKMYHEVAQRLYALLDDIDTAGDIAKGDDTLYRKIVERTQSKKGTFVIYCDGQTVRLVDDAMLSAALEMKK